MKPLIFNSTPLIYLTKAGLIEVLEGLEGEKLTPPTVKREVVDEGKRKGIPDAVALGELFEKGVFKICKPLNSSLLSRLMETKGLHTADAEVLTLAKEREGLAVVDDAVARKTAKVYGIPYVGTPYILIHCVCEGFLSKDSAKQALNSMISAGWRCSVESYAKIIEILDKTQKI